MPDLRAGRVNVSFLYHICALYLRTSLQPLASRPVYANDGVPELHPRPHSPPKIHAPVSLSNRAAWPRRRTARTPGLPRSLRSPRAAGARSPGAMRPVSNAAAREGLGRDARSTNGESTARRHGRVAATEPNTGVPSAAARTRQQTANGASSDACVRRGVHWREARSTHRARSEVRRRWDGAGSGRGLESTPAVADEAPGGARRVSQAEAMTLEDSARAQRARHRLLCGLASASKAPHAGVRSSSRRANEHNRLRRGLLGPVTSRIVAGGIGRRCTPRARAEASARATVCVGAEADLPRALRRERRSNQQPSHQLINYGSGDESARQQ